MHASSMHALAMKSSSNWAFCHRCVPCSIRLLPSNFFSWSDFWRKGWLAVSSSLAWLSCLTARQSQRSSLLLILSLLTTLHRGRIPLSQSRKNRLVFFFWATTTRANLCFVSKRTLKSIDLSRNGLTRFYPFWIWWRAPAIFVVSICCKRKRFMGFYGCSPTFLHLSGMLFCTIKLVSVKIASTTCSRMLWKQVCWSRHLLRLNLNNAYLSAN